MSDSVKTAGLQWGLQKLRQYFELFSWGWEPEQQLCSGLFAQQSPCLFWVPKVAGKPNTSRVESQQCWELTLTLRGKIQFDACSLMNSVYGVRDNIMQLHSIELSFAVLHQSLACAAPVKNIDSDEKY